MTEDRILLRIALALERIAVALEGQKASHTGQVTLKLDGKALTNEVIKYTLSRAAQGPSTLLGGTLHSPRPRSDGG